MICYTSDLKKKEFKIPEKQIGEGTQGKIYKLENDRCIKVYEEGTSTIKPEIFVLLKELSPKGVYKLYELLYRDEKLQEVLAYIMKYYQREVDNILDEPVEYTLHNIEVLHKTSSLLADNQILVNDRIPKNVVLGKENITMIDLDSCRRTYLEKDVVLEVNTNNLLYLFKKLYIEGLEEKGIDPFKNKELITYLDTLFSYSKEPAKTLSRRMCGAKKPYDLLYWRC